MTPAIAALALLAACNGPDTSPSGDDSSPPDPVIGNDVTVTGFEAEPVYFTGKENLRQVDKAVTFPDPGQHYSQITLNVSLSCPTEAAISGTVSAASRSSTTRSGDRDRAVHHAVPRGRGVLRRRDRSPAPARGRRTLRVFIDTWVGPGSPYGDGWLVDASFDFEGGLPERDPFAVVPLWAPHGIVYGDPGAAHGAERRLPT